MEHISTSHKEMNPVSPKLATARYLKNLPWTIAVMVVFAVLGFTIDRWFYLGAALFALLLIWQIWLIPNQVKRIGWLETPDELLITKGKLWNTFTLIPYGRIQFVDVTAGPLERWLGMKTIQLNTASATSDSTIQGLPADQADALRDRLAEKARERMSGL